jgi:hypothetical protein
MSVSLGGKPLLYESAACGHLVDLNRQSMMELCPACVAAIPPLRDDQTGLGALGLKRFKALRARAVKKGYCQRA